MRVAVIYHARELEPADVINVFGPKSKERYNPQTVERVATSLDQGGHTVKLIEGNIHVGDELRDFMPRVIAGERPGMVFNMAYGIQGQSRYTHVPALLEMLGVPYVGSGPQAHAVALDKIMTKIVFQQHGIPTPQFWFYATGDEPMENVIYPVIVKPKMEAVSMGLKIVSTELDLRAAVKEVIANYQQEALVERFIAGREFAVGLLGNGAELEILPIVEFDLRGDPNAIQTKTAKLSKPLDKLCPAPVPPELAEQIRELARRSFNALNCYDFARIDLRMDAGGKLYVLELNSMASLGLTGSYVHSATVAGYPYESLINRMLDVAAVRYFGRPAPEPVKEAPGDDSQPLRIRVRSYLRSHLGTMEDYLRRMAAMNTYVHNVDGVNTMGAWITDRLSKLGFKAQVHPQTEVGNILYFKNHDEAGNDILVLSHLDTANSFQDYLPLREDRGRFYGSGVAESKGGLAVLLGALQSLRFTRRLGRIRCAVLLTTDDRLGGRYSRELVEQYARSSRAVIGLKYGEMEGGLVTACQGVTHVQVDVTNLKRSDTVDAPDVIQCLCTKLLAWQRLEDPEAGVVFKPTLLEARVANGLTSDHARAVLMYWYPDTERGEALYQEIRQIGRKGLAPGINLHMSRLVSRPAVVETPPSRAFFDKVQGIAKRLEVRVKPVHRTITSEICHVPEGIPVIGGFGPLGGNPRTGGEFIVRDSLVDRAALLAMVTRLSSEN